ncbi:magnesium transporter [Luteithermobacter gelatinilyticus]|uniref:magnesium transporter n=1 Tax=Luteithermobacter gelatinilyticus TaxID=2582913 RepID=UPI001105E2F2|nr:magnesium transporter [Luteithermobacter gelatinilyticus]
MESHPADTIIQDRPWERLNELVEAGDIDAIAGFLSNQPPSEAVRAFLHLDADTRQQLMTVLPAEVAADLLEELPDETLVNVMDSLSADVAAPIVEELYSDEQADLLGEMDKEKAEAILAEMDPEAAEDARRLVTYDPETAGGLMMSEVFCFPHTATVADVLKRLTSEDEDFERYRGQHPYVVDEDGRLVGVVSLRNLLLSRKSVRLENIMTPPLALKAEAPIDEVEDYFDAHSFLGAPVVDEQGRLLGVISRDAFSYAIRERADATSRKMQGVLDDELRTMPTLTRARRRLSWLSINIVLNVIAASVIALNQETLASVIALAVFLPIVSDMSGCSGNQAVAVSLRELALGVVKPLDLMKVLYKEAVVGLINGAVLGFLIAAVAWGWKGNPWLGLVVGLALGLNTIIAVSIGGTVPLILKKYGADPAVASGPILTTVTDMVGFFLVLSLASLAMPLLV